jgi:hypothetical protein
MKHGSRGRGDKGHSCGGHYGRLEFRRMIETRLLPSLRAYAPDLIFISAGFDGSSTLFASLFSLLDPHPSFLFFCLSLMSRCCE